MVCLIQKLAPQSRRVASLVRLHARPCCLCPINKKYDIQEALHVKCSASDPLVLEALRGVRLHFVSLAQDLAETDVKRAQLGLAHSYSRAKVKFNVHKSDNMIIQAIALVDQLDKDINTFAMRLREWYSWHFPELVKITADNIL
eukprot:COSAG05_NODE_4457_length_1507_cov_0.735085_1_plen_144_part_00